MYAALWRVLPGPAWLRVLELAIIAVAIIAVCFTWVFPAIAPILPFNDVTVD
jgi:hypothetical protein